jgi:hypothetical protein
MVRLATGRCRCPGSHGQLAIWIDRGFVMWQKAHDEAERSSWLPASSVAQGGRSREPKHKSRRVTNQLCATRYGAVATRSIIRGYSVARKGSTRRRRLTVTKKIRSVLRRR